MAFTIQYISIIIEVIIAILGVLIFFKNKQYYGLGFFITFGIYVFYDLARLLSWAIPENVLYISFFIASLSALYVVWMIYKSK